MADRPPVWDAVVVGAGVVGAAIALALRRVLGVSGRVMLCDPELSRRAAPPSLRAVAIAPDMRQVLETQGVWTGIAARAQPVTTMVITDARPALLPNPAFLTFGGDRAGPEPLAHMIFADDLRAGLRRACEDAGVAVDTGTGIGLRQERWAISVELADGRSHRARLLVAADGANSRLRHAARIQVFDRPYPQSAIVATLTHPHDHRGQAVQHFFPSGPIALLPLRADDGSGRRTSLVWTEASDEAERLAALPPASFTAALQDRVGLALGALTLEDRPRVLPLRLRVARHLRAARLALVGDAARVIHPLAGQGLNLGLRDADALARHVGAAAALGLDPGSQGVLDGYERERRPEAAMMAGGTDLLERLFSNDNLALRSLRDIGLSAVDRMPLLKRRFVRQAGAGSQSLGEPPRSASLPLA